MKTQYYSTQDDISYTPLSLEEENALFAAFHGKNDLSARDELIRKHLKLAAKLSLQLAKGMLPEEDSISAGNLGLVKALDCKKFRPGGVRFNTYVRKYILGEVSKAMRFSSFTRSTREQLSQGCPRAIPFVIPEGAAITGIGSEPEHGYLEPHLLNSPDNPADATANDEIARRRVGLVAELLDTLPDFEAEAIRGEFFGEVSFADTARRLGVTREGVRKAYVRGMAKLTLALSRVHSEEVI